MKGAVSDPATSTDVGHIETESEGVGSVSGDGGGGEENRGQVWGVKRLLVMVVRVRQ